MLTKKYKTFPFKDNLFVLHSAPMYGQHLSLFESMGESLYQSICYEKILTSFKGVL